MTDEQSPPVGDAYTDQLALLYRDHPQWRRMASYLDPRASCAVWFSHRPGEPWRLRRKGDATVLEPGRARDPDLVLRFTPAAIEALAGSGKQMSDFAIRLFELMIDPDESRRVAVRVAAPFVRIVRRGYVRLLLVGGGPRVAAFAARHGIRGLLGVRRLVAALSRAEPFDFESATADEPREQD